MPGDKFRFRFSKTGTLRLLSHHDLMRCFERMLRRAALPYKSTAGFHPGPRIVFAQALPLGVDGLDEVVEIEFTRALDESETLAALRSQAPIGLEFTRARVVSMKTTALPRRIVYRMELPPDRIDAVAVRCAELMAADKAWVERLKPGPKRLNIRPYLRGVTVTSRGQRAEDRGQQSQEAAGPDRLLSSGLCPPSSDPCHLILDLWVTGTGTARVDELMKLLGVADLVDSGAVAQRSVLELRDEVTNSDPTDSPPDGPADTLPLDPQVAAALSERAEEQAAAAWGVSPAGPVVE